MIKAGDIVMVDTGPIVAGPPTGNYVDAEVLGVSQDLFQPMNTTYWISVHGRGSPLWVSAAYVKETQHD